LIGPIAQFKVVLDANIAVNDLVHKLKHEKVRRTAIEEAVKSGTIELYAPTWLDEEMIGSTIPQVAAKRGISEPALQSLWVSYKEQIIWDDTFTVPEDFDPRDGDAKDVPYVALQESLLTAVILSEDKGIDRLGGTRTDLQFVMSVRDYARAASYVVGIRIGSALIGSISVGALVQGIRGLGHLIGRMPDWAKIALLGVFVIAIAYPQSRHRIFNVLKSCGGLIGDVWPELERLIDLDAEKKKEADTALEKSERLLGS